MNKELEYWYQFDYSFHHKFSTLTGSIIYRKIIGNLSYGEKWEIHDLLVKRNKNKEPGRKD